MDEEMNIVKDKFAIFNFASLTFHVKYCQCGCCLQYSLHNNSSLWRLRDFSHKVLMKLFIVFVDFRSKVLNS